MPVAANLLARDFTPAAPNWVWTGDITYIQTGEGWLCLAIVLDLFNREIVGWSIKPRMTANIVTDALKMAWFRRKPDRTPIPSGLDPRVTQRAGPESGRVSKISDISGSATWISSALAPPSASGARRWD